MKKICIFITLWGIVISAFCQKEWITFSNDHPVEPIVTLITSSVSQIVFTVELTGMYQQDTVVNSEQFQRISILKNGNWGIPGYPELPAIYNLLAIPECESMTVTFSVLDSVVLDNYNVYPNPLFVTDSSTGNPQITEVFTKNDSAYSLDKIIPYSAFEFLEASYIRSQKVQRLGAYPFRYNPVLNRLVVYTNFEVLVLFTNSQTEINRNIGYFGNIAKNTLLNYQSDQIPELPPQPAANPGMIHWVTMTDPAEASDIVADYLIISDHQFFEPHNLNLTKLANHRASFNGFDVAIVDVQNILSLPFSVSNPLYSQEQKIRDFIQKVYEGGNAHNTYDGKVAFVLLVGDAVGNTGGVPASKDPNPGGPNYYYCFNDYYYSCITTNISGWHDMNADIFIGRMCADDSYELSNIVKKTCDFENEYTGGVNKKTNTLACGGVNQEQRTYFTAIFADWLNELYSPDYTTQIVDSEITGNNWNREYTDQLNNQGSNIVIHYGHGDYWNWCKGAYDCMTANTGTLTMTYKKENLVNLKKYPVVISNGCHTNMYAEEFLDCVGEEMTVFSATAGYVAYYGTYGFSGLSTTVQGDFPKWLWEHIPYSIFHDLSQILGECILESQLKVANAHNGPWYAWNLLGDPALNLMAPGYEITSDVSLSGITSITSKIFVRENAKLSISGTLHFEKNGQLIIDPGAILEIANNTIIKGKNMNNVIRVNGMLIGRSPELPNPPDLIPIENVTITSLPAQPGQPENKWQGFVFNNGGLNVQFKHCTVRNCKLSGTLNDLEINGGSIFQNASIDINDAGFAVDQSDFSNSDVLLTNFSQYGRYARITNNSFQNSPTGDVIKIDHYPAFLISNNHITYASGSGINLSYCGNRNSDHTVRNCTIEKSGNPQDLSWGIMVYHSFADIINNKISNNKYGIGTMNLSSVKIEGIASAQSEAETQRITDNYQNQVKCFDNSFPYSFHYNVIGNSLSSFPLIYHDQSISPEPIPDPVEATLLRNIKCNCFPPSPLFYPAGGYAWQPTWCPPATCTFDEPGREDYEIAIVEMDSGNYSTAESLLKTIISEFPDSKYGRESAKSLLTLTCIGNHDFPGLKAYYDTTQNLHIDSLTHRLTERLMTRCDVERKAYAEAIEWYENAIETPFSYNDSVYSIIDLEDTYVLAEADSNLKSASGYQGQFTQYIPENREEYMKSKDQLIRSLFKETTAMDTIKILPERVTSEYILYQNTPNPFNNETEVSFFVSKRCDVSFSITSLFGQKVKSINMSEMEPGDHSTDINFKNLPDGTYIVSLLINEREVSRIKCIKRK